MNEKQVSSQISYNKSKCKFQRIYPKIKMIRIFTNTFININTENLQAKINLE